MAKRRGNGEGSITQRKDGTWQGQVTLGRDCDTGKLKRKSVYGKTRKEVQQKVNDILGKVRNNTYSEPTKLTVGEWLKTWINDYMKNSIRITTWESYKTQIDKHIIPEIGFIKLSQLQTGHLQKLYNDKLQGGRADGKPGGLSPRTVRYIHIIIHSALQQAIKERMLTFNPTEAVKLPQDTKKEMKILDTAGVKKFLQIAKENRYYTAYYLELSTGLRRGELLGLRWQDIDMKNNLIHVKQQIVRTKKGFIFQKPKTKLSCRQILVSDDVITELKSHKKRQAEERKNLGLSELYNGLVFTTQTGTFIQPDNFKRSFKALLKRAKLPNIRFHDMRHTFATMSLQQGVDIKTLQADLGHHTAAFTMDVYGHVTQEMKKDAANKRGKFLKACITE